MTEPTVEKSDPTAAPRAGRTGSRPVWWYLLSLVLAILIPALVVSLVLLNRNNQAQQDVLRALTNATVQAIGQSVESEISGMITTLRVLSTSELLSRGEFEDFHARARTALIGSGAHLLLLDPDLGQILNTRVPFGTALGPTSDPESAMAALRAGRATVSGLFFGRTAQRWVFNVLLPVPDNPDVSVLILTQNASNLTSALQSRQLPEGWHAALVDGSNVVIAATPETNLQAGAVLPMRQATDLAEGKWQEETIDGQVVVTSEWRAGLSGWRVIAWAARDVVERPLGEALLWLAAWGVIIAVAAAALAFFIAQRVGLSVRGLRRDAQRLGRGDIVVARAYPVTEIAEVSVALAAASKQRQAADSEVRFLMREVAHRSKNQMTVIAAMAKQTARGADDVASYVQGFERRILGLARSTDLLLAHGLEGVAMGELVRSQIAPFCPTDGKRLRIEGPPVRLNVQAAQILGMAVHELATNAVKYGAFAGNDGSLSVRWSVAGDRLEFVWRETVKALPADSGRVGFGTTVLKSMVGRSLGAEVERIGHADGLEWRFSIPLAAIDPTLVPAEDTIEDPDEADDVAALDPTE